MSRERKRTRTAWHATSRATATVFDPPHPAVEPNPPTPLVLRTEHVRAMQRALGLTPERASHALLLLPPAAERAARAMLPASSPKRAPRRLSAASAVTPVEPPPPPHNTTAAHLGASTGASASPITPHLPPTVRALFAAPTPPTDAPVEEKKLGDENTKRDSTSLPKLQSLFSTASGKRVALPRAGATNLLADVFADCVGAPGALRTVPQSSPPRRAAPTMALFTTASGKPVPPPPLLPPTNNNANAPMPAFNTPRPRKPPISLFTTASGKSVPVPSPAVAHVPHLNQNTPDVKEAALTTPAAVAAKAVRSAAANPHHVSVTAPFATPSPLPRPRSSHVPPSSAAKCVPSAATSNTANPSVSSSIFLSAAQSNTISAAQPSNSILDTRSASRSRSLPSPHTPSLPMHHLRKALFPESVRNSSVRKSPHTLDTPLPPPTRSRRRRASAASTTRTTPFKRPRRLLRPSAAQHSANNVSANQSNVPQFALPALLTNGLISCTNPHSHNCPTQSIDSITPKQLSQTQQSTLQSPSLLLKCHDVIFRKHQFGQVSCLPPLVANALNLGAIQQCDVSTFVHWMKQMFPAVDTKPASCVGSEAWTRMAYSLAVCKLLILQSTSIRTSQSYFFCAANVVREFLRRLSVEWHQSKQPHLLRIMRNDSSPSSHVVVRVVGIEQLTTDTDKLSLIVSDGWYVARCSLDDTLQSRVWRGRVRIGDKVSISGSTLQTLSVSQPFFFGEADELGASYLRVTANGLHKAPSDLRLGIRKPAITKSLKGILDGHGTCPPLQVVVLRTYPVFYRETVAAAGEEDKNYIICRREEGEDEARSAFAEKVRRQMITSVEKQKKRGEISDPAAFEVQQRSVSCVKDMLVCGTEDDPNDCAARKLIRIYNAPESLHGVLKEGQALCLMQVWPRPGMWICKPEAVRELSRESKSAPVRIAQYPRKICSIADLQDGSVAPGEDFDGIFAVLYVTPDENNVSRFVYLTDDPGNEIRVLALELCDEDAKCLPRALRFRGGLRPRFPLLVVQDAQFKAISKNHDLVHANTTLRSSLLSARAIRRQRKRASTVRGRCEKVESHLRGKEEQLEILREAVVSFVSGETGSIGAYFTSTQDM